MAIFSIRCPVWPTVAATQGAFIASLNALPALNFTVFVAAMAISAPVVEFLPVRAARFPCENEPKPTSCTLLPLLLTARVITPSMASIAAQVSTSVNATYSGLENIECRKFFRRERSVVRLVVSECLWCLLGV